MARGRSRERGRVPVATRQVPPDRTVRPDGGRTHCWSGRLVVVVVVLLLLLVLGISTAAISMAVSLDVAATWKHRDRAGDITSRPENRRRGSGPDQRTAGAGGGPLTSAPIAQHSQQSLLDIAAWQSDVGEKDKKKINTSTSTVARRWRCCGLCRYLPGAGWSPATESPTVDTCQLRHLETLR